MRVAEVIPFRLRPLPPAMEDAAPDIDLVTALDVAIRDLKDLAANWCPERSPRQAEDCRLMLERALASLEPA